MIDLLIVKAPLGTPQDHHEKRLVHVGVRRLSSHKVRPSITFINGPLTAAQMEVRYWIEHTEGIPLAIASVKIPLASATIGQNYAHAGLDDIRLEMRCAAWLVKIALTACGFSEREIHHFIEHARTDLLELTWHTQTKSRNAQRNLMKRTREAFDGLRALSSRQDVFVRDVDFRERNNACGLLVTLKTGDEFRQYPKYDQVVAKTNKGKSKYAVAPSIRPRAKELLEAIDTHGRNEIILGADTLAKLGLSHPDTWTPESLRGAIDWFWCTAGLNVEDSFDPATIGDAARQTLTRYKAGDAVEQSLSAATFTRHRQEILAAGGPDIDPRAAGVMDKLRSVGRQLAYDKRWRVPTEFRNLVLCDATAPAIIEELKQGLEYVRDGVLPEIADETARDAWLVRWNKFVQSERLWDQQFGIQAIGR
ncbi:hypothetical protein C9I57_08365 [Trinickia symbiotica]|uniref:Uncharacterized protein n=1 Tax=Trinickia symbiotica TaxID=863227 RepID=A0A2T3XYN7_9BURK|nr:hypothetical protein [Trinickia symbiotica]PTB21630.1 hypothetical protein C9I57_08365 [Trinickia symbiotica]